MKSFVNLVVFEGLPYIGTSLMCFKLMLFVNNFATYENKLYVKISLERCLFCMIVKLFCLVMNCNKFLNIKFHLFFKTNDVSRRKNLFFPHSCFIHQNLIDILATCLSHPSLSSNKKKLHCKKKMDRSHIHPSRIHYPHITFARSLDNRITRTHLHTHARTYMYTHLYI